MKLRRYILIAAMLLVGSADAKIQPGSKLAVDTIVNAVQQGGLRPTLSATHQLIYESQAYEIQHEVVDFLSGGLKPDGFKAGLTTPAAQQKFSASGPVAGVLLSGSLLESGGRILAINRLPFVRPMFEVELGFRFNRLISERVQSVADLQLLVDSVSPVVELPDLAFETIKDIKSTDIIANNVLAKRLIAGPRVAPDRIVVNGIKVSVYRDGKEVMKGVSGAVMDNQWQALLWLVNHTLAQGYTIEPGQICITGAISGMAPLVPGQYVADFGSMGVIRFTAR